MWNSCVELNERKYNTTVVRNRKTLRAPSGSFSAASGLRSAAQCITPSRHDP